MFHGISGFLGFNEGYRLIVVPLIEVFLVGDTPHDTPISTLEEVSYGINSNGSEAYYLSRGKKSD